MNRKPLNTTKGGRGKTGSSKKHTPKNYNILAMGDSVMWGQGVLDYESFTGLTQKYIKDLEIFDSVKLTMLAHSGAIIGDESYENVDQKGHFYFGELPKKFPDLHTQFKIARIARLKNDGDVSDIEKLLDSTQSKDSAIQQHSKIKIKKNLSLLKNTDPDLIFIDGGANDYKIENIILNKEENSAKLDDSFWKNIKEGFDHTHAIEDAAKKYARRYMKGFLRKVSQEFPSSKIIVTGYYPVFTKGSLKNNKWENIILFLLYIILSEPQSMEVYNKNKGTPSDKLFIKALSLIAKSVLLKRTLAWYESTNKHFKSIISEINLENKNTNIFYAIPEFGEENGVFAKKSCVFGFRLKKGSGENSISTIEVNKGDHRKQDREEAYDTMARVTQDDSGKMISYMASIGHPNQAGHKKFFNSIKQIIDNNFEL